jgi:hypothetical protein
MNALVQVDALTLGVKAEMKNANVITESNYSVDIDGISHVYLASSIPSVGGNSISAITPDFLEEGIMATPLAA